MKKILTLLKSKLISQLVTASFAILFMIATTACTQPSISAKEGDTDAAKVAVQNPPSKVASPYRQDPENTPEGQITEFYDSIQPREGGINNYSDVDPRQNTSKADAKARKLVQQASHPEADRYSNPLDAVKKELDDEPISERMQKFSKDVADSAKDMAKDTTRESNKGIKNIKENSKSFLENTKSAAGSAADRMNQRIKNTTEDTADVVDKATDILSNKTH